MFYTKRKCLICTSLLFSFFVMELTLIGYHKLHYAKRVRLFETKSSIKDIRWREQKGTSTTSESRFDLNRLQNTFKDEICKIRHLTLRAVEDSDYRTALVSFPASGNTWTRHLIQQLTGLHTCEESRTFRKGVNVSAYTSSSQSCVVYKSHLYTETDLAPFRKAVILIRNPMDALKSFFHYRYGEQEGKDFSEGNRKVQKHKGYADTSLFNSPKWTSHVRKNLKRWKECYIFWLTYFRNNSIVIVYEEMKENIVPDLLRISQLLKIEAEPKEMWCTLVNKEGRFHRVPRNKIETSVLNLFTAKEKEEIYRSVCEVSNVAKSMNLNLNISQYLLNLTKPPDTEC